MKTNISALIILILFLSISGFAQLKINSSGFVGIGKDANTTYRLDVNGTVKSTTMNSRDFYNTDTGGSTFNAGYFKFLNPFAPPYVTSVGINTTPSSSFSLDVSGPVRCTAGIWQSSDVVFKKNIEPIDGKTALKKLLGVQG